MPESKKPGTKKEKVVHVAKKAKVATKTIVKVGGSQMKEFLYFIRTQGVVGLAVGLVLGGATSILVRSLIDNVIMPPIGLLLGSSEGIKGLEWVISTPGGKQAIVQYGIFLNDLINFFVIALVIYFIIHFLKLDKVDKPKI